MRMQKVILSPNAVELNGVSMYIDDELMFSLRRSDGKHGTHYTVTTHRLREDVYAVTFAWLNRTTGTDQRMTFEVTKPYQEVELPVEE